MPAADIPVLEEFAVITAAAQTAVAIGNDDAPGHKMLEKLRVGLARIQEEWARVAAAAGGGGAAAAGVTALAAMDKFIIVEKYPGGSRRRRQSKKRKNQRNHNNNQ